MTTRMITLIVMVLAAAFSRMIPHPWNFTAVGAMALFGGAYFSDKRLSMALPLAALMLSDLFLGGFHSTTFFVYAAFALIVMMGWYLTEKKSVPRIGGLALVASSVFFLISNFGVWIMDGMYAPTFQGLVQCYVAAIPFFGYQVAGDLFFSAVMFGGYELVKKYAFSPAGKLA
ncbi:DUF6580 family putative transport protein [Bdellovibrio sp. HCB185ZH]|uniref:DUF6580 family putative transport protein n=1 Tax=Bdellovibrio sp. HCB185ZH TaxID=3394235 RepID=UPI0039A45FCB